MEQPAVRDIDSAKLLCRARTKQVVIVSRAGSRCYQQLASAKLHTKKREQKRNSFYSQVG